MRHVAESRCHCPLSLEEKVSGGGEWRVTEGGGRSEVKGEGREGKMKGRVKGMDSHVINHDQSPDQSPDQSHDQ